MQIASYNGCYTVVVLDLLESPSFEELLLVE